MSIFIWAGLLFFVSAVTATTVIAKSRYMGRFSDGGSRFFGVVKTGTATTSQ